MDYVALLRAVNVGGRWVSMAELRATVESLGYKNVRSLLQSGNLIFASPRRGAAIERDLEIAVLRRFGFETPIMVRSAAELDAVVSTNPFKVEAKKDPGHLIVVFLKSKAGAKEEKALRAAIVGRERILLRGKALYAVYPDGVGRSKLTAALIDRHLGTSGTARNWNTVSKLRALAKPIQERRRA
jgi:uncharacterized protein (DUF1697 family)